MIVYISYNNNRKEEFQITTEVIISGSKKSILKIANNSKSISFLHSFFLKYKKIKKLNFSIKPIKPIKVEQNSIGLKYQNLPTLYSLLKDEIKNNNKKKFISLIENYTQLIRKNQIKKQKLSSGFIDIFSPNNKKDKEYECLESGCLDLNFDNIFVDQKKQKYFISDYEWTFNFPIPYKYIIFRAVIDLYSKIQSYDPNKIINLTKILKLIGIQSTEIDELINFEYNFQKFVIKNNNTDFRTYKLWFESLKNKKNLNITSDKVLSLQNENQELKQQLILNITSDKVLSLQNENQELKQQLIKELNILTQEKKIIQLDLNKIQSSKTYKLWQKFNKLKKIIIFPFKFLKYIIRPIIFYTKYEFKKLSIKKTELKYLEEKFIIDGVSFIIPTWNKEEMVVNCVDNLIEKLENECKNTPKEIIVVDNGSSDNTTKSLRSIKSNIPIKVIHLKENIGFGPAINLATKKSKYNYVYLLNNDMFPQNNFFSETINFAKNLVNDKTPFFGLSSQIFFYDKTKRREESGKTYITPKFGFINVAHCVNENNLKDNSITAYPGGGSSLLNKYIFEELGFYDFKSYKPLYCEDLDSGFVAWKIGYPSYYIAKSHVIHHHRSSSRQLTIDPDFIMHKNWLTFILKNINNKSLYFNQVFSYGILCILDKKYCEYSNEVFKNIKDILKSKLFSAKFKNKYNEKDLINFIDFETKHEL